MKEKRSRIFTIPNIMSIIRLALIPVFCVLYARHEYPSAGIVLLVSALSDVCDGIIARKFDMISDVGKVLDPIADKLTQIAVLICIAVRHCEIWPLVLLFFCIQIFMGAAGLITMKKANTVISAKWYGKVNTVLLEGSMIAVVLFEISGIFLSVITAVCSVSVALCFILYMIYYYRLIKENRKQ